VGDPRALGYKILRREMAVFQACVKHGPVSAALDSRSTAATCTLLISHSICRQYPGGEILWVGPFSPLSTVIWSWFPPTGMLGALKNDFSCGLLPFFPVSENHGMSSI
jgi:hypothetical protein